MNNRRNTPIRIADARGTLREACSPLGADIPFTDDRFNGYYILPGFTDVHVHLREPGFSYKETIRTGSRAAAAGGFTQVLTMPNLDPVPDRLTNLQAQTDIIARDACIGVYPLGSLTRGEKGKEASDIEALAPLVAGFSDDGVGVMDDGLMREAMQRVKDVGSIVVAHCEDTRYPRESREAEYRQLDRDLNLAAQTGCPYHMCHASTLESIQLIREAKRAGLDVTCETAPHYLTLCAEDIAGACREDAKTAGRFKMNPPIKTAADREALLEALQDGTIDMIATDHAPHSAAEKSGGFAGSAYGIVGLETAFPVLYTKLVRTGLLPIQRLVDLLADAPNRRFGIGMQRGERGVEAVLDSAQAAGRGRENVGNTKSADGNIIAAEQTTRNDDATDESFSLNFAVWDLETPYRIDPSGFESLGRSTPFAGWEVYGRCMMTVYEGEIVYRRERL